MKDQPLDPRDIPASLTTIHQAGVDGRPLNNVYPLLSSRDLLLMGYARISDHPGSMTAGVDAQTADGTSLRTLDQIGALVESGQYRWSPVRSLPIPKPAGGERLLGIPTWSDRLLQEAIRLVLNAYYDPQFSSHSHGFRPGRSCGTALLEIARTWGGVDWFVEGDISRCFDSINHRLLLDILAERIRDKRFLELIRGALASGQAGGNTGAAQGSVMSPILANVYLDRLDRYIADTIAPRFAAPSGFRLPGRAREKPAARLHYVRYADDFLLGLSGTRAEADKIKDLLRRFLKNQLKLTLSDEKTAVTPAASGAAHFLGYDLRRPVACADTSESGVELRLPGSVLVERCDRYLQGGVPVTRADLFPHPVHDIILRYAIELRSFLTYYRLARNLSDAQVLQHVMEDSLVQTLAAKLRVSPAVARARFQVQSRSAGQTLLRHVTRRPGQAITIAQWGPFCLKPVTDLADEPTSALPEEGSPLANRLLADTCELCGSRSNIEVHHVRRFSTVQRRIQRKSAPWAAAMASRRSRVLVVCRACHDEIHGRERTEDPEPAKPVMDIAQLASAALAAVVTAVGAFRRGK